MSDVVISVENLSKQYRLGTVGTGALRHDLNRLWYRVRGKEDPYLRIGQMNDRTTKADSDYVWALKDINFEVKQGEVLGIIGRNGAGKSTLLKILSKITAPTSGLVKVKGRIASLLEVGTGFHPELTGRENIFLNGAILGMRKEEIRKKFDEIVDFSGVEAYIDTPVKRYSSGMYVRLAFAVAAYLDPEILVVDEVLAVGDAEFQSRCLGRMKDVSVNDGRTVLFVSHNMSSIQKLCKNSLLLEKGNLANYSTTDEIISDYTKKDSTHKYLSSRNLIDYDLIVKKANVDIRNKDGSLFINLLLESKIEDYISIDFRLLTSMLLPVGFGSIGAFNSSELVHVKSGVNEFNVVLSTKNLAVGNYILSIDITKPNVKYFERLDECLSFEKVYDNNEYQDLNQSWNYGSAKLDVGLI